MNLFKEINKDKILYLGLIITFTILYAATAFVSWFHAITFFNIANAVWLSVILSFVAELGQASVLFEILSSKKQKFLSWSIMILLTSLQIIGNVVSSYKYIIESNNSEFVYFQKSILFWVQTANPEMFKVIIAWIVGGILPIIALSMTALVADKLNFKGEDENLEVDKKEETEVKEKILEESKVNLIPSREEQLEKLKDKIILNAGVQTELEENPIIGEGGIEVIKPEFIGTTQQISNLFQQKNTIPTLDLKPETKEVKIEEFKIPIDAIIEDAEPEVIIPKEIIKETKDALKRELSEKTPITKPRGWHFKKEYIDSNGDVYRFGKFITPEESKKA